MTETDGAADGGRWLTYAELAEVRGITRKAAVRMTQRHRWRRTPGNDGAVRIFVPDAMAARTARPDARPDAPQGAEATDGMTDGMTPFHVRALAALEDALATLRGGHTAEIEALRATHAGEIRELRARIADTEARLSAAEAAAKQVHAEAQEAHDATELLRQRERE
jgi:hypothetical protein